MSLPNIPNIDPCISISANETFNLLMSSIAMKGLGLSHLINAEAEKVQFALGTLHDNSTPACLDDIIKINHSVRKTLNSIMQTELLLLMQMNTIIDNIQPPSEEPECSVLTEDDFLE